MLPKPILPVLLSQLFGQRPNDQTNIKTDYGYDVIIPKESYRISQLNVREPSGEYQHEIGRRVNDEFVHDFDVNQDWLGHRFLGQEEAQREDGSINVHCCIEPYLAGVVDRGDG